MAKKNLDEFIGTSGSRTIPIMLWVPSADRDGRPCNNQDEWKVKALTLLAQLFGSGATAMPPADGVWLNPQSQTLVYEKPIIIYCYVSEQQVGDGEAMRRLGQFCREMGKDMYQGEVALRIGERFFLINTF